MCMCMFVHMCVYVCIHARVCVSEELSVKEELFFCLALNSSKLKPHFKTKRC